MDMENGTETRLHLKKKVQFYNAEDFECSWLGGK